MTERTKSQNGKRSRRKGQQFERDVVKTLNTGGIEAERVPLSGAAGGSFGGDIVYEYICGWRNDEDGLPDAIHSGPKTMELKKRADGFKQIYSWLEGNDALVIGADRKEPLIVLTLSEWIKQVGGE